MRQEIVILGGGPAGLTAAYQFSKEGIPTTVVERDAVVGGLARTVLHIGFRIDIGGHRFFTKAPEVQAIWQELLADEFLTRPRLSRIYYRNRFFRYPLQPLEALAALGPVEAVKVALSYLWARARRCRKEESFEQWVSNRFGRRLYTVFFKTYTEKVWGIPCAEIGTEWAAQRIEDPTVTSLIRGAFFRTASGAAVKTLSDEFGYPRLGPGQMWERCRDVVRDRGHRVLMGCEVARIHHNQGRVTSVMVREGEGRLEELPASQVISSMALPDVARALDPAPPPAVLAAAGRLRYRDFLTVALVVNRPELFPDTWLYIHSPLVRLGRIQNYRAWSPDMVPESEKCALGLEYFVWEGNDLWTLPDEQLVELGTRELEQLGLVSQQEVTDGTVVRMRRAYPVYDAQHREAIATIRDYLEMLPNLQQVGRNGQHRYNNQDHSMLTAMLAVRNVLGERHDVWDVNADAEYHETIERAQPRRLPSGQNSRSGSTGSPAAVPYRIR
jgi:protoporphyrinogen oxidase